MRKTTAPRRMKPLRCALVQLAARMFSLRLPPSPPRRRPPDLLYAADDKLPIGPLLILGGQHATTAMAFITYVLAAAKTAGLDREGTQSMVAMTLIGMAICTALQAWGGRFGSGTLLVHMPNPFMITFVSAMVAAHGPGAMAVIALVYGVVALAVGPLMTRMRPVFPPAVVGTVISMGGIALVESAMRHTLGLDHEWRINVDSVTISGATLGIIIVFSVWGAKRLRLLSLLAGIVGGILVAAVLGRLEGLDGLRNLPIVALPALHAPVFNIDVAMVIVIGLIAILTQLDNLGSVTMLDKMDDADWKRANMKAASGGIKANGIGDLISGMLGGFPTCTCSSNIALAHATRSTARRIGLMTAVIFTLVAFFPKLTLALTLIPEPVLGAVELYAACFLIVSGFELIASRAMDSRGIFTVGLAICIGLSIMLMPKMTQDVPASWRFLVGSGFVMAGLVVIALNLLFRLGTSQRATHAINTEDLHNDIINFVESQGAAWGVRRKIVQRAAMAALEAAEAIHGSGVRKLQSIRGSFDEFNLDLELVHTGLPLNLGGSTSQPDKLTEDLLDADEATMQAALDKVSGMLLMHLADRVQATAGAESGQSVLKLHFEH